MKLQEATLGKNQEKDIKTAVELLKKVQSKLKSDRKYASSIIDLRDAINRIAPLVDVFHGIELGRK